MLPCDEVSPAQTNRLRAAVLFPFLPHLSTLAPRAPEIYFAKCSECPANWLSDGWLILEHTRNGSPAATPDQVVGLFETGGSRRSTLLGSVRLLPHLIHLPRRNLGTLFKIRLVCHWTERYVLAYVIVCFGSPFKESDRVWALQESDSVREKP